ncbi:MAG: hypothetical protein J7K62_04170, partial [Thermoplasmata archaeon]|nr:hypothetical protein [Thermoplasmata archaeon]
MKLKIILTVLLIIILVSSSSQSLVFASQTREKIKLSHLLDKPSTTGFFDNPPLGEVYRITEEDEIAVLGRWNYDYAKSVKIIQDSGQDYMAWKESPHSG